MAFKNKEVIALIPARGGSKGVKRKNMRMVLGKPLLMHTIEAAQNSPYVDKVWVSSDDFEILEFALKMGVNVIERTAESASDSSIAKDVVNDFAKHLSPADIEANPYLLYLQPTSPMRSAKHINAAFAHMLAANNEICLSVTHMKKTPFKCFTLTTEGRLQSLYDETLTNSNRQSLPPVYYPNGAIYLFPLSEFFSRDAFPSNGGLPYVMPELDSFDIDTEDDLIMLERICRES